MSKELRRNILSSAKEIRVNRDKKTIILELKYPKVIQARMWQHILENFRK